MSTVKKLALGASLLISTACSSVNDRSQDKTDSVEHAHMDQELAEAVMNQPVQAVQDVCAQQYKNCTGVADTALAKASLDFAAQNGAIEKIFVVKRPLYTHMAKGVYENASTEWKEQTLGCKEAMKSCLE